MKLIHLIKNKLGLYKPGFEYYIPLKDIIISKEFKKTYIKPLKWKHKIEYYKKHNKFESNIIINKNFILIDGYSSYKIAKYNDLKYVPVYFEQDGESIC